MNQSWVVFSQGNKQYLVSEGEELEMEKIEGKNGDQIKFDKILLFKNKEKIQIGQPCLTNVQVLAEIKSQKKAKKVKVNKFKAKSRYRRRHGHRQLKTIVTIKKILVKKEK